MSNLLKDASILLTPTGYENGRMNAIKPSKDLYGSELVTNGNFATDSDWSKDSGWSIVNGQAICNGVGINSLQQSGITTTGKTYKLTFDIISKSSDDFLIISTNFGDTYINGSSTSLGTNTFYITPTSGTGLRFRVANGTTLTIDNVSVVEDLSGDFQFERNSAATRVNAQGLVENVQIISPELVSNGNFSQIGTEEVLNGNFSQEGSELVTNGDFATDSDWSGVGSNGFSISGGKLILTDVAYAKNVFQANVTTVGKTYKVTFEISDYVKGNVRIFMGSNATASQSSNGIFTSYVSASANSHIGVQVLDGNGTTLTIDNVSVKEVGQNWDLGSGFSIGENKAIAINSSNSNLQQVGIPITNTKKYKINFTISDYTSGSIRPMLGAVGAVAGTFVSANGTYTEVLTANNNFDRIVFRTSGTAFNGSITNISVKEVGQDWTFGTGWSIGENKAISDASTNSYLNQQVYEIGKKYKLEFEVLEGTIELRSAQYSRGTGFYTIGTYSIEVIPTTTSTHFYVYTGFGQSSITNVSVKEITDDTNIPRINYEGFSYQDSLGSELVVNGDFSVDSNWTKGTGWSISDGKAIATNVPNLQRLQNSGNDASVIGKTYKYSISVSNVSGAYSLYVFGAYALSSASTEGTIEGYVTATSTNGAIFIAAATAGGLVSATIDNVSVKEYLGQEVVPDSGCGSWLLEPQSTNLIPYSSDFSSLNLRGNAVVTSNEVVSPSGDLDADKITFDGTANGRVEANIAVTIGQPYTISLYLKNKDLSNVAQVWIGFSAASQGQFVTITDEWQRYDITTNADGTTEYPRIQFSGTGSLYAWGFQTEQQSYATSYIPTNGATNTRLQDIANNSGNSSLINSTEGVLYAEIAALADDGTFRQLTISDGSSSNRVSIDFTSTDNQIRSFSSSGGSTAANMSASVSNTTQFNKVAVKYKLNDYALWVNGVEVATDTSASTPIGLSELAFDNGAGGNDFRGKAKALAVYKEALTDAELQSLTTQ